MFLFSPLIKSIGRLHSCFLKPAATCVLHLKVVIWWVPTVPPALPAITPLRNWVATGKNNTSGCTCWHTWQKDVSLFGPDSDIFRPPSLWVGAVPSSLINFTSLSAKPAREWLLALHSVCIMRSEDCPHLGWTELIWVLEGSSYPSIPREPPLPVSLGAYPTTLDFPWKWPVSAFFKKAPYNRKPRGRVGVLQSGDCWAFVSCKQPGMPALSEKVVWLSHGRL